jgi:hypothetical protein
MKVKVMAAEIRNGLVKLAERIMQSDRMAGLKLESTK